MKDHISTGQAAELCSVTPDTVLKWIKAKRIPAIQTPGGHYRIHRDSLIDIIDSGKLPVIPRTVGNPFQFCWEYYKKSSQENRKCVECIVYRSRAIRCYEVSKFIPNQGRKKLFCQGSCDECEYFRVVQGQQINVLIISEQQKFEEDFRHIRDKFKYNLRQTDNEYHCSMIIESFRPDYVVIDESLGEFRCNNIIKFLSEDPRIPFVKIIIAGSSNKLPSDCDKKLFAVINNQFSAKDVERLIGFAREDVKIRD